MEGPQNNERHLTSWLSFFPCILSFFRDSWTTFAKMKKIKKKNYRNWNRSIVGWKISVWLVPMKFYCIRWTLTALRSTVSFSTLFCIWGDSDPSNRTRNLNLFTEAIKPSNRGYPVERCVWYFIYFLPTYASKTSAFVLTIYMEVYYDWQNVSSQTSSTSFILKDVNANL